jgi:hypothetical protein
MRNVGPVLLALLLIGCDAAMPASPRSEGVQTLDPMNPCSVLEPHEIADAVRSDVERELEVESRPNRDGETERLCLYRTGPPYTSVTIQVHSPISEQEFRRRLRFDPLSTKEISHVGDLAFIHAGVSLSMLVSNTAVTATVQHFDTVVNTEVVLRRIGAVSTQRLETPSRNGPASSGQVSARSATPREVRGCPLTTPPNPAFVPPESDPPRPPDLYEKEWYGTAALWTWLDPEGEVWKDLPDEDDDGRLSEKTFWWSEAYSQGDERVHPITITARRLDRPGSFETRPGTGGFREDIGSFMLVGMEIPAGCWELTATYRSAELSYVVLVEGRGI